MDFETGKPPNRHTKGMGELIRKAREDAGLTQEELADKTHRRRTAVYEMEKGKVEVNAWTIVYLADALNKPITYFYPKGDLDNDPKEEDLSDLEKELINNFRYIPYEGQKKLAIQLIKDLGKYSPGWDVADAFRADENPKLATEIFFEKFFEKEERRKKRFEKNS